MPATIQITDGTFTVKNNPAYRGQPELEWKHRLKTREHLKYLGDEKLFNVSDSRWAKNTINGEVCYAHEYEDCFFVVRLKTADGKFNLSHNEDGAFDRHLMASPGEDAVYSLTSSNNGLESTHTFSVNQAGIGSIPIICVCLALSTSLANGVAAAEAAEQAAAVTLPLCGVEVEVTTFPVIGIILAILSFIGLWIAYAVGREIMLNLTYENRSEDNTISLVDHYFYNIGDHNPGGLVTLGPLQKVDGFELYTDVVITIDNYSKIRGIGVSLVFQKEGSSFLAICIRNDIYKNPHYIIAEHAQKPSAEDIYNNCTSGGLITADFQWGKDLVVKNCLDPDAFNQYTFAGILSFNDAV